MSQLIMLRDVLQRNPNGTTLIAEAELTQDEFDVIRTTTLLTPDTIFELPTVVYWYDAGNPPKPVFTDCPEHWRGKVIERASLISLVNRRVNADWLVKYKSH